MVPTVYQQETGLDMIIGNNFLRLYASYDHFSTPDFQDGYWKMWNSFRLLSDHNSKLFVTLDNL
jgi:ribulose bisphosphate carboxylase small subunit